jgi:hypothetical protein
MKGSMCVGVSVAARDTEPLMTRTTRDDEADAWLREHDTYLSEEMKAGEEVIKDDFVQWIPLGEGCRMKIRHRGAP